MSSSLAILLIYLLASSRNRNTNLSRQNQRSSNCEDRSSFRGRNRFGRSGKRSADKQQPSVKTNEQRQQQQQVLRAPPLTDSSAARPSYFSCRHTYEETLMQELDRRLGGGNSQELSSPCSGIVRVEPAASQELPKDYDPVYALQSIPNAVVVSAESIKGLAKVIYQALLQDDTEQQERLRSAPRGSLALHSIVPGMARGQPKPDMEVRAQKVVEEVHAMLKKGFPAARSSSTTLEQQQQEVESLEDTNPERWLLQVMLVTSQVAVASLTSCQHIGPAKEESWWPSWHFPLGLAKVDIVEKMPSSAYRKLLEALETMRIRPTASSFAVDLGACPGGWTSVLRRLDCPVISVDRSELDPKLMKDPQVKFVQGDAFTFEPEGDWKSQVDTWMVSDVIAYPERVAQLLERWCGGRWARCLVVTMKFQGDVAWDELDHAIGIAHKNGYMCRAKHFFNNKNEVTLMANLLDLGESGFEARKGDETARTSSSFLNAGYYPLEQGVLGTAMYKAILPSVTTTRSG